MTEPKLGWGLNYLATSTTQLSNRSHLKCFVTATKYLHLAYVSIITLKGLCHYSKGLLISG